MGSLRQGQRQRTAAVTPLTTVDLSQGLFDDDLHDMDWAQQDAGGATFVAVPTKKKKCRKECHHDDATSTTTTARPTPIFITRPTSRPSTAPPTPSSPRWTPPSLVVSDSLREEERRREQHQMLLYQEFPPGREAKWQGGHDEALVLQEGQVDCPEDEVVIASRPGDGSNRMASGGSKEYEYYYEYY